MASLTFTTTEKNIVAISLKAFGLLPGDPQHCDALLDALDRQSNDLLVKAQRLAAAAPNDAARARRVGTAHASFRLPGVMLGILRATGMWLITVTKWSLDKPKTVMPLLEALREECGPDFLIAFPPAGRDVEPLAVMPVRDAIDEVTVLSR